MNQSIIKSPDVKHYTECLGRIEYRLYGNDTTYDSRSYKTIDKIFELLENFTPVNENGMWELWLTSERGPIEAFGDYEEMKNDGDVDSYEEFKRLWLEFFPEEKQWYYMAAIYDREIDYKAIFIDHRQVIEVDSRKKHKSFEYDISEYTEWLLDAVRNCYEQVKAGTYNERVKRELPPEYKTGTIVRKAYYEIFPEYREEFLECISNEEIDEFISVVAEQPDHRQMPRIQSFTANDFYKCCALGYKANNYKHTELTPKEQYYIHADGRDGGLKDIDEDSTEAFSDWIHNHISGHPWEVCSGGNSTHIDLLVHHDDNGFYLAIRGSSDIRCVEAVKFFLAIHSAGYPVYMYDAAELTDRFLEREKIGIVPKGVFPRYCSSFFPDEDVIDYMNLPYEKRDEIVRACEWQPLREIRLMNKQDKHITN